MTADKPICSLSLDLDNQWSYMKTHGDSGWDSFPSYLDLVVPRFLEILDDFAWKITVFVVGQDAALEKNHEALKMIADAGHEIGNHSFNHEPWLHCYSEQQVGDEIIRAQGAINSATGQRPRGFRGPGYSLSRSTVHTLAKHDYRYDASTLPTFLGPLARAYYFMTSDLSDDDKLLRKQLFGGFRDGFQSIKPYVWGTGGQDLLEIPVTTMPIIKLPFHFSYLLFVATISEALAVLYFKTALAMCRATPTSPSLLLHPLDFVGGDDVSELAFFPAMKWEGRRKRLFLQRLLGILSSRFSVRSMGAHAEKLREAGGLKRRPLDELSNNREN